MKDLECPNCGASQPQVLSAGEFKCKFCGQLFYNEAMRQQQRADDQRNAHLQANVQTQQFKTQQMKTASGMGKRVLLFVGLFLVVIFSFVAYMTIHSMNEAKEMQEEMMKEFRQ